MSRPGAFARGISLGGPQRGFRLQTVQISRLVSDSFRGLRASGNESLKPSSCACCCGLCRVPRELNIGDCQNYGPFWGPYYNTGPNLGDPKRDHNYFDHPPYSLKKPGAPMANSGRVSEIFADAQNNVAPFLMMGGPPPPPNNYHSSLIRRPPLNLPRFCRAIKIIWAPRIYLSNLSGSF